MANKSASDADCPASRASLAFGWAAVALFVLMGLSLEFFHLLKVPLYLEVSLRRELWVLAHAHGTLLAIVNIVFALTATRCLRDVGKRARASLLFRAGAVLVPAGFFFGGIGNAEGDPSLLIMLVPAGALCVLWAAAMCALGLRRS